MLHIIRISADQIDVKSPIALGIKAPIVEIERKLEFGGRLAAARAASFDVQLIWRVGEFAFQFIPVQIAILRFGSLRVALESGAVERARQASLPVKVSGDNFRWLCPCPEGG